MIFSFRRQNDTVQRQYSAFSQPPGYLCAGPGKNECFYKETFEFTQTDKGDLGHTQLVFLSRDPAEHHQLVLATGRPDNLQFNLINQISFRVPNLDNLRRFYARAKITKMSVISSVLPMEMPFLFIAVIRKVTGLKFSWIPRGIATSLCVNPLILN